MVRKKPFFSSTFWFKTTVLPRQARDKHKEKRLVSFRRAKATKQTDGHNASAAMATCAYQVMLMRLLGAQDPRVPKVCMYREHHAQLQARGSHALGYARQGQSESDYLLDIVV